MKKLTIALVAATSMLLAAPLPTLAAVDVAAVCDGSVPEAWTRPGGFCDQNDFNRSLSEPNSSPGCEVVKLTMLGSDRDARMLLAEPMPMGPCGEPFDPCHGIGSLDSSLDIELRGRVVLVAC